MFLVYRPYFPSLPPRLSYSTAPTFPVYRPHCPSLLPPGFTILLPTSYMFLMYFLYTLLP